MMNDLTPEEKKQVEDAMQIGKEMQEKGITPNITSADELTIPPKQDKILSEIPTLASRQQYSDYLESLIAKCRKNIDPSIVTEVDALISRNSNNTSSFVNLGTILLIQKKPVAAIYAAIKIAMAKPDIILLQNNMAVILHETGNPQISLPILNYLLTNNNCPLLLNNLAQSYLSLGDTTNAGQYFRACLQKDPDDCEANCGLGLLLTEEGNISEANEHIIRSLRDGYSETAEGLAKKNKTSIKFEDIRSKVPEYFNGQNFKPVPPVYEIEKVEPTLADRKEFEDLMRVWMQKKQQINQEQSEKPDKESFKEMVSGNLGVLGIGPFSKKAQLMMNLIATEYYEFASSDFKNQFLPAQKEFYAQLEKLSYQKGYDNDGCKSQIEFLKTYLQKSAKNHEAYQRETLPKLYEWVNQSLYWSYFLSGEEQYKANYSNYVSEFLEALHGYDEMQSLYPLPEFISKSCKDVKEPVKVKTPKDSVPEVVCPVKIEIPLEVAKIKWDCKTFEIEGGELIMGGFERDFKTGEMTLFVGLGAELFSKGSFVGGIEAGFKAGSFVKLGRDLTILDMGNKGEIGADVGIGPFITERKLTGVMGMKSGIQIEKINMGNQTTIYNSEPSEMQVNPEINIFK
jgi:hypothetical protein